VLFSVSMLCGATENPNVGGSSAGNSFKSRNAPVSSSRQQRFLTRPHTNIYGESGNDIVTGNVGGGKHFRGVVPYGSSYYSGAYTSTRGSGSVNNFLRRSSNPIVNDRNPGRSRSYYDPRRSVSSMRRPDGTSGLSNPQLTGQGRRANPYVIPSTAEKMPLSKYQRPLSTNNMDLEQILVRREQLRQEAEKETEKSDKKKGFFDDTLIAELIEQKDKQPQEDKANPGPEENILTNLLSENQRTENEQASEPEAEEPTKSEKQDRTQPDFEMLNREGRKVLGEHETFASLADEKFANFMEVAEEFVKDGQFYKAADTYALAVIWKPEDARGSMGQSFSLLAAGEYMSSAYYLSRAFKLDARAATKKYNLAKFIDNQDVFESRILELSTWQERSKSGELAFLLAYISYQDGKAVRAVKQIRKAKEAMPNSQAISVLKHIIDPEEGLK